MGNDVDVVNFIRELREENQEKIGAIKEVRPIEDRPVMQKSIKARMQELIVRMIDLLEEME